MIQKRPRRARKQPGTPPISIGPNIRGHLPPVPWSNRMRLAPHFAFAALVSLTAPVRAEPPDCATFPNDRARFACYDAISRAPKPEPKQAVKTDTTKPKPAIARGRKLEGTD